MMNDRVDGMRGAVTPVFDAENSQAAADGDNNLVYGAGVRVQVDRAPSWEERPAASSRSAG
jgi:hypothetical protein